MNTLETLGSVRGKITIGINRDKFQNTYIDFQLINMYDKLLRFFLIRIFFNLNILDKAQFCFIFLFIRGSDGRRERKILG